MTVDSINILMLLGYGEVLLNSAKGSSKLFTVYQQNPQPFPLVILYTSV